MNKNLNITGIHQVTNTAGDGNGSKVASAKALSRVFISLHIVDFFSALLYLRDLRAMGTVPVSPLLGSKM